MKAKNILREIVNITLLGALSFPFWGQEAYYHLQDFALLRYTERNVPRLMKELEEELDISYTKYPEIEIMDEEETSSYGNASYNPLTDTLKLNPRTRKVPLTTLFGGESIDDVDKSLSHELGHVYADQQGEQKCGYSWPDFELVYDPENGFVKIDLLRAITEGMGVYFEWQEKAPYTFYDEEWPEKFSEEDIDIFRVDRQYRGGYHFIKSLVKEFGMERVVDYFITHPLPELQSLREIPEYQTRVAEELWGTP